jgi:sRNA-binding protein
MSTRPILTLKKRPAPAPAEAAPARSPAPASSAPEPDSEVAVAALAWLRAAYPAVFTTARPLAIGVGRTLAAARPAYVAAGALKAALAGRTRRPAYLKALAAPGAHRVDLAGNPIGPVTGEHRAHAAALLEELRNTTPWAILGALAMADQ